MKKMRLVAPSRAARQVTSIYLWLFVGFLFQPFAVFAQDILDRPVILSIENVEIRMALQQIEKAAGVKFVFSSNAIPPEQKVTVKANGQKLGDVLQGMLAKFSIGFDIMDDQILLYKDTTQTVATRSTYNAEKWIERIVTGVVTDVNGEPIPGVSILIKGTTKGTQSDAKGAYSIAVNDGDVLIFSFIGYKTSEWPIENRTSISVQLEQASTALAEVVVTGYGDIRKESFTGSTIAVSGQDLKKVNPNNLLQGLQTFDPSFRVIQNNLVGSNPNRLPEINVRGTTALPTSGMDQLDKSNLKTNPNLPTFILDGFQVTMQTVYDLDINRIESVTFLKDAAATAIYGSRAANGVLIIKTKTPKEGELRVSYNFNLAVTAPDLTVYDVLNAEEKLEYERLAGLYDSRSSNSGLSQPELTKIYFAKYKNVISGVDTYWLADPVSTALDQNHSLMLEGGSKAMRYSLTARYQDVNGVMKGSYRNRYGADMSLSYHPGEKITFANTLSVMEVKAQESPYGSFAAYVRMNPYYKKTDEFGNALQQVDIWPEYQSSGATNYNVVLSPLYDAKLSSFDRNGYTQFINNFKINWTISSWLMLNGNISYQKIKSTVDQFKSPLHNDYFFYSTKDMNKRGEYHYEAGEESIIDGNMSLSFNKSFGNHFVGGQVGANLRTDDADAKGFTAVGFTNDRFENIGFAGAYREHDSPSGAVYKERLVGTFVSVNYSYADKYLFDLIGRIDGSSKFGTENKTAPFWSAGIGWNLHNETKMPDAINILRLRATTGLTGEVSFPPYMTKTTYAYFDDWYSTGVGVSPIAYGNESLRWQRTHNYELGADVIAFDHRVSVSARYYYKLTDDLVTDLLIPPSTGFGWYKDNLGQLENKGFELLTDFKVIRKPDWDLGFKINVAGNKNKIKQISESLKKYNDEADANQGTSPLTRFKEGESIDALYAVRSLGIDPETGREIFVKKDGSLTFDHSNQDIVVVGTRSPDVDGFVSTSVRYKNFMLDVWAYVSFGSQDYNQTLVDRVENADPRFNVDQRVFDQRWKAPGDVALYKNIADLSTTWVTSRFVQDNNIFEIRSANLSYETPTKFIEKIRLRSLRWGLVMNDVWRWSTIRMERGIDYPFARTITLTVNATF